MPTLSFFAMVNYLYSGCKTGKFLSLHWIESEFFIRKTQILSYFLLFSLYHNHPVLSRELVYFSVFFYAAGEKTIRRFLTSPQKTSSGN